MITSGKTHDLAPIKNGFLNNQTGIILADSGYVSKDIYLKLMQKNLTLIAKPKNSMKENNQLGLGYLQDWNQFKFLYKKRTKIERYFSYLKENLNMVVNKLHSTKSLYTHIYRILLIIKKFNFRLYSLSTTIFSFTS